MIYFRQIGTKGMIPVMTEHVSVNKLVQCGRGTRHLWWSLTHSHACGGGGGGPPPAQEPAKKMVPGKKAGGPRNTRANERGAPNEATGGCRSAQRCHRSHMVFAGATTTARDMSDGGGVVGNIFGGVCSHGRALRGRTAFHEAFFFICVSPNFLGNEPKGAVVKQ